MSACVCMEDYEIMEGCGSLSFAWASLTGHPKETKLTYKKPDT